MYPTFFKCVWFFIFPMLLCWLFLLSTIKSVKESLKSRFFVVFWIFELFTNDLLSITEVYELIFEQLCLIIFLKKLISQIRFLISSLRFCSTNSFSCNSDLKKRNVLTSVSPIDVLIEFMLPLISDKWTSVSLLFEGLPLLLLSCLDNSHLSCWFCFGFWWNMSHVIVVDSL